LSVKFTPYKKDIHAGKAVTITLSGVVKV